MSSIDTVLAVIAQPGQRSQTLATALCILVRDGAELGELEERAVCSAGETRIIRVPPRVWIDRLSKAAEVGALDRKKPREIAEHILSTPVPA